VEFVPPSQIHEIFDLCMLAGCYLDACWLVATLDVEFVLMVRLVGHGSGDWWERTVHLLPTL
jgi:hypothetical protein